MRSATQEGSAVNVTVFARLISQGDATNFLVDRRCWQRGCQCVSSEDVGLSKSKDPDAK